MLSVVDSPTTALALTTSAAPPPSKTVGSIDKKASKPLIAKKSYMQASKSNILSNIEDVL